MHPEFPGRVFADKKSLMVVLAYHHSPLPAGLNAPPVQQSLKSGGYGESPIQALVDSEKYWKSNGDPAKADACRAEIDKRQGPSAGAPAAPSPAAPPSAPSKLTTKPSKRTSGWTMFYLDGAPLIEVPPDMAAKFQSDYEQAQGDEDLEADVVDMARKATEAVRQPEPEQAPADYTKISPTGDEDEDFEVETTYGGTAKAYTRVTLLDAKNPDGSVKIDPKTKKPVKFRIARNGIEVFSPYGEMVARYALTSKKGNIPSQMTHMEGSKTEWEWSGTEPYELSHQEPTKLPGTIGDEYESFSKIELQKDEIGEYVKDKSGKTKQRTVGELSPSELAKELGRFVKPQDLSGLFAHIGLSVPGRTASTKVIVRVAGTTKVIVRVAGFTEDTIPTNAGTRLRGGTTPPGTPIARWESRGNKHFAELYDNGDGTYSYRANGAGGHMGEMSLEQAMLEMEKKIKYLAPDALKLGLMRVENPPNKRPEAQPSSAPRI
jgi:hypothetical protein